MRIFVRIIVYQKRERIKIENVSLLTDFNKLCIKFRCSISTAIFTYIETYLTPLIILLDLVELAQTYFLFWINSENWLLFEVFHKSWSSFVLLAFFQNLKLNSERLLQLTMSVRGGTTSYAIIQVILALNFKLLPIVNLIRDSFLLVIKCFCLF